MIEHVWTVLCARSIVDQSSNNISLLDVIEQINVQAPPLQVGQEGLLPIHGELVTLWTRSVDNQPCRADARIRVISPSGTTAHEKDYSVDLMVSERVRTKINIPVLSVRELGRHHFSVLLRNENDTEWHLVATVPFVITLVSAERTAPLT